MFRASSSSLPRKTHLYSIRVGKAGIAVPRSGTSYINARSANITPILTKKHGDDIDETKEVNRFSTISKEEACKLWPSLLIGHAPRMSSSEFENFIKNDKYERNDLYLPADCVDSGKMADVGRFQLFGRETLRDLFPEGMCGDARLDITMLSSRTSPIGMMLRKPTVELLEQLRLCEEEVDTNGQKAISRRGFLLDGHRGAGKSYLMNQAVAWARSRGWLVILEPYPRHYTQEDTMIKRSSSGVYLQPQFATEFLSRLAAPISRDILEKIPVGKGYGSTSLDGTHKLYAERSFHELMQMAVESELQAQDLEFMERRGVKMPEEKKSAEELKYEAIVRKRAEDGFYKDMSVEDPRMRFLNYDSIKDVEERRQYIHPGHEMRAQTKERRQELESNFRKKVAAEERFMQENSGRSVLEREKERLNLWQKMRDEVKPVDITQALSNPENLYEIVELGLQNESYAVAACYELMEQLKKQRSVPLMVACDAYNDVFPVSKFGSSRYENTRFNGWIPSFHLTMPRLFHKFDGEQYNRGLKLYAQSYRLQNRRDFDPSLLKINDDEIIKVNNFSPHEFAFYVGYLVRKKVIKQFPSSKLDYMYMATAGNGYEARRTLSKLY